jgi:hypothetical protein
MDIAKDSFATLVLRRDLLCAQPVPSLRWDVKLLRRLLEASFSLAASMVPRCSARLRMMSTRHRAIGSPPSYPMAKNSCPAERQEAGASDVPAEMAAEWLTLADAVRPSKMRTPK